MTKSLLRRVWIRGTGVLGVAAVGASVYLLHKNDWQVGSIGAVRFLRSADAVGRTIIDYKWNMFNVDHTTDEYRREMHLAHERGAKRLLRLCELNGGCFIKVGQGL